jgi:hypothetical protein
VSGRRRAERDYFARIPNRVYEAHRRGDLPTPDFLVLVVLICEIDRVRHVEEVEFTLRALAEVCDWPWSRERLRLALHTLAAGKWIGLKDPGKGSRRPWRIWLEAAAIDAEIERPPTDLQPERGVSLEVDLRPLEVAEPGSPLGDRAREELSPPSLDVGLAGDETELGRIPPFGRDTPGDDPLSQSSPSQDETTGTCPGCARGDARSCR